MGRLPAIAKTLEEAQLICKASVCSQAPHSLPQCLAHVIPPHRWMEWNIAQDPFRLLVEARGMNWSFEQTPVPVDIFSKSSYFDSEALNTIEVVLSHGAGSH